MKDLRIRDLVPSKQMRGVPLLAPRTNGWSSTSPIRPIVGWQLPLDYYDVDQGENGITPQEMASALSTFSIDEAIKILGQTWKEALPADRKRFAGEPPPEDFS